MIVELGSGSHRGFGEATTNPYYNATFEAMTDSIEALRETIESLDADDPVAFWNIVQPKLVDNPFALCALDEAVHDLWGKVQGKPVYELWGLKIGDLPQSNFTIGIDSIETMVMKLNENPDWPIYKIKLGTENDIEIVTELRQHTDARFRVDANCGWTAEQCVRNAHELNGLNVEFIEQPLPADDLAGQRFVYENSSLPIVADESCIEPTDVEKCDGIFHGINIKLMKCGGLTPARRMIDDARSRGLKVMVGCMTESTVGISAIAQLLPLLDFVDMDGAALLSQDIATGVQVKNGNCLFPKENGCGVNLLPT